MGTFINTYDLAHFATIDEAKAIEMIADAESTAVLTAPCIPGLLVIPDGETPQDRAMREARLGAVKAVLRGAILRWNEVGSGAVSSRTEQVGPIAQTVTTDTRPLRRGIFWPSEIEQLQSICASTGPRSAFSVDVATSGSSHLPWCSLLMGGSICSCGADIAGEPIYEGGS